MSIYIRGRHYTYFFTTFGLPSKHRVYTLSETSALNFRINNKSAKFQRAAWPHFWTLRPTARCPNIQDVYKTNYSYFFITTFWLKFQWVNAPYDCIQFKKSPVNLFPYIFQLCVQRILSVWREWESGVMLVSNEQ